VRVLLIVNVIVYMGQLLAGSGFTAFFALSTFGIRQGWIWQFFTYMFLHSTYMPLHLIFNMLVLFFMGPETERGMGTGHFLAVYLLSGVLGGLAWIMIGNPQPCIGASGAIFGVLGAFAMMYPHRPITLLLFFVLPVTMKAWVMVAGLAVVQLLLSIGQARGGIAYSVHVSGIIVGVAYTWAIFRRRGAFFRRLFRQRPRLQVFRGNRDVPSILMPEDVDRILDKIARHGMSSLTREERRILEEASRNRNRR
jgi:membrane associated rhomboid family serine protease